MPSTFEAEDHILRWPRELFRGWLAALVNAQQQFSGSWSDEVEHLLDDAFATEHPVEVFRAMPDGSVANPWGSAPTGPRTKLPPRRRYLVELLQATDTFPYEVHRRPYRSQRNQSICAPASISVPAAVAHFLAIVADLEERGYFERAFQKDCVDNPRTIEPSVLIEEEIGIAGLWPIPTERLIDDFDLFMDLIEVFGEFVAAPQSRSPHSYGRCGWHHGDFNIRMGRDIYFWTVNRLLARTSVRLRLATSGEDRGRLVEAHGDARDDLVGATIEGADAEMQSPIEHAISLFRRRGATAEDKRSACTTLAGVLEFRRSLLKESLFRRDEGALFQIANEFDVRHRSESQKGDYDPVFLDWIFWWYLGTIELTDRMVARQNSSSNAPPF